MTRRGDPADEARRLRRYVLARAAGREATGWTRRVDLAPGLSGWVWCSQEEAAAVQPRSDARRVRTPGQAWCRWLGRDVFVAVDLVLQAALQAVPEDGWGALVAEVRRSPSAILDRLRHDGHCLLAAADRQPSPGPLASTYIVRGRGSRSLMPYES